MTLKLEIINALEPLCDEHPKVKKSLSTIKKLHIPNDNYFETHVFFLKVIFENPNILDNPASYNLKQLQQKMAENIEILPSLKPEQFKKLK